MKISNPDRRSLLRATLAGAAATVVASPMRSALAQGAYPTRPIKLVVGFAPGGPTDILGRVIGKGMGDVLGEQVVIENRTGAGGNIGTDAVARSTPDGYTLLLTLLTGAVNESLFKNFKTRFAEHFESIGGIAQTGLVLVVHPSLPVKSVSDLIKYAKAAKPGELFYATAGAGTSTHLAAELFNSIAGIKLMPVHYRGGGDTIKDLISGRMPIMFSTIPPVLGFVRDGQLRGLATSGSKRDFVLPELPTIVESGLLRFRRAALVRADRTQGHAAAGDPEAQRRDGTRDGHAGDQEGVRGAGLHADADGTRRVREVLRRGGGQVGQGRPRPGAQPVARFSLQPISPPLIPA